MSRALVLGLGLAALLLAWTVLRIGLAWLHYRSTPTFEEYVAAHPVEDARAGALWLEEAPLGPDGVWREGEIDPLSLAPDDPAYERVEVRFEAGIRHGDETLLDLVQVAVFAFVRGSGERRGVVMRTETCRTAPGFRARARIGVMDSEHLVGPDSSGKGRLVFEALLLAGEGPARLEVVMRTEGPRPFPARAAPSAWRTLLFGGLYPVDPLPEAGLVHALRQDVLLMFQRGPSSGSGAGFGEAEHWVNTQQYSYRVEARASDSTGSHSREAELRYTWNGRVW